jgi:hypothetical protein
MPDIEGIERRDLSAIYLYPRRKTIVESIDGDDGERIEGTEEA